MKELFTKLVLGCCLFLFSLLANAVDGAIDVSNSDLFGKCQFSLMTTKNLSLGKSTGHSEEPYCSIGLSFPRNLFSDTRAAVFVFGTRQLEKDGNGVGFSQDSKGNWSFKGTELLLSPKMLKTSFTKEQCDDETILVGYQSIRGSIAQGGPITVPGIRILRITPKFVASVQLNFQPSHYEKQTKGYKQLRESVSKELVDLVKSIQATHGTPGPTIRNETSPVSSGKAPTAASPATR